MRNVQRPLLVLGLLAPLMLGAPPSAAQTWPQRTVKFLVPLGPGSGVDIGARLLADRLSTRWDQPVVVENRPGGDGIVAISAFVGAHDDHILLGHPRRRLPPIPISTRTCRTSRAISCRSPECPTR
jgi:tripartite-type tricarboxylate transporter receptor subunit TctC